MKKTLLCLFVSFFPLFAYSSWYEKKLEGWYYFEDLKEREGNIGLSPEEAEKEILIKARKLNQLRSLAILIPSEHNILQYLQAQKLIIDQSSQFASSWEKVLLSYPELGSFLETPTSSYGILAKRDYDTQKRNRFLEKLSENHFLLIFFEGKNPFSAKAIEVAQLFASTHQWKFKAVSLDGIGVDGLESFEQDKGISKFFRITSTPALFVVEPTKQEAHPVGVGLLTVSELEKNIEIQLEEAFEQGVENLGEEHE